MRLNPLISFGFLGPDTDRSKSYLMAFYKTFIDIFQIFSFNKVVFF